MLWLSWALLGYNHKLLYSAAYIRNDGFVGFLHDFEFCSYFFQAAELIGHPLLQPYVHKIHLKLNNPRRNTLSGDWFHSSYEKKTRFIEPEAIPINYIREKRRSFSNDRNLNPSFSGTEQESPGSSVRDYDIIKSVATKLTVANTPRLTPTKVSATPRRQLTQSKVSHISSKRDSVSSYILKFSLY